MSALGQKQTCPQCAIACPLSPESGHRSFDEHIDTPQKCFWNSQVYGPGRVEVDGQLEFRRLLYRYIFRRLALISGHSAAQSAYPLYPQKQTFRAAYVR